MCCAHTHGVETSEHSTRPHVHLSGETRGSHPDSHHHDDHSHPVDHDHDQSNELRVDRSETNLDFQANLPVEHDSDAIYFGDNGNHLITSSLVAENNPSFTSLYVDTVVPRIANSERRTQVTRAGTFTPYFRAVFLQTRRLLL